MSAAALFLVLVGLMLGLMLVMIIISAIRQAHNPYKDNDDPEIL